VKKRNLLLSLTFVVSAFSMGACGRAHLSSQYAQSYTAWFTAQHAKAKPANAEEARKIIESLDAGEAAAVSKGYRKARGAEESGGSRMLMIGASKGAGADSYMPAASSVPQ
jgi:hypothetical protein